MTRQRALILEIMREQHTRHMTADEIFCEARQVMPHIARGTVYRNLKMTAKSRIWRWPAAPTATTTTLRPTAIFCAMAAARCRTCRSSA